VSERPVTNHAPKSDRPLAIVVGWGMLVGGVGGVGAWVFRMMIAAVHNLFFLGRFSLVYDANLHTPPSPWGAGVVLVPVAGAVAVVFLVKHFAPEAKGHGVPEVMEAIYYKSGVIRPVVAVVKAVASAISIGSGGSVGREGPIVQIGSAFGSTLGQTRRLSVSDTRLLIAAGSAAGIAATFNAPIGGVLFAVELLLVAVNERSLLTVGAAVVSGVGVARGLLGGQFAFTVIDLEQVQPIVATWVDIVALAGLGIVIGLVSVAFIHGLYWAEDRFDATFSNPYVAHMIGMGMVGLIMFGFHGWLGSYSVQGVGYATITDTLGGVLTNPWTLLALGFGKWLVTVLTLGSGASGGIFSPGLFLGATVGAAMGHLLVAAGVPVDPAIFALGGMAGSVAGVTGAVITSIVMVAELTGDFGAVLPLLVVAVVANAVRRMFISKTIYTEKLSRRGLWVPTGLAPAKMETVRARDVIDPSIDPNIDTTVNPSGDVGMVYVDVDASLFEVLSALEAAPVVGVRDRGKDVGVVSRDDLYALLRLHDESAMPPHRKQRGRRRRPR
jgi:CIC family chloride channel protein